MRHKIVCTSWQNVIQFLLAMISGQLSNSRQSLIQLCAIQKWYNRKIMQKCEYGNQGNLRQTLKEYFRQNYFKMIPWGNWMIEVSKFWLKCLCSFSMQPRRKFFLQNFKQNLNNSRSLLVARVKMRTSCLISRSKKLCCGSTFLIFLLCWKIFPVEKYFRWKRSKIFAVEQNLFSANLPVTAGAENFGIFVRREQGSIQRIRITF